MAPRVHASKDHIGVIPSEGRSPKPGDLQDFQADFSTPSGLSK
jgi:hypothetical protein